MDNKIMLSVVDTEKKYVYDPTETVYGANQIVSWGQDNAFPFLLGNCYEKSATLMAAIQQSINYTMGDGVKVNAGAWQNEINRRGETMEDLLSHIVFDYFTYGNFAIQVIFNALGVPTELYALDVTRCRLNGSKNKVYYSKKSWTKYQTKAEEFDRFGYKDFDAKHPTQIYFYNGAGVRKVYNNAPWEAALNDVLVEIESSEYSLSTVTSGFTCRYLLNIPDAANLTDEQKQIIEDGIKEKFCGYDAPSNFMLYWANDEGKGLTVNKIESDDTPERFVAIRKNSRENIFTALRLSPLLVGASVEGTGFSSNEFSDSFKLYEKTCAMPNRKIFEKAIEKITGVENAIEILPFVITFEKLG